MGSTNTLNPSRMHLVRGEKGEGDLEALEVVIILLASTFTETTSTFNLSGRSMER